jgi:cytochrome P450
MVQVSQVETREQAATHILDAVGDVARPRAGLPVSKHGLEALPGKLGLWNGISNAFGWMKRGRAHLIEQVERNGLIYKQQFVSWPAVFVADPELVAQILRNEDKVWSSALAWRLFFEGVDPTSPIMDSPVTYDFDVHKDSRKLLQPAFSGAAMASYIDTAIPMLERGIDAWVARGKVSFKAEVRRLFALIAGKIFLGFEDEAQAEMLDRELAAYWRAPLALARNKIASPTWRRAVGAYRRLFDWLMKMVPERRASGGDDLFSRMCKTAHEVDWIDDRAMVGIFIGVLAAAFDTTSCGVTSMAYELARNPEWQLRLRESAAAEASGKLTHESVRKLDTIEWAWKESLRLYPVAADVPRRALRDVELGGYQIPAGTLVMALMAVTMNDPKLWKEPARFDPLRFAPDRAEDKKVKGLFMPFGGGAHACIGAQLSTLEAKAFWHVMLSRCKFELARPYEAVHQLRPLGMVSGDVELTLRR